jgi:hypothetical protein
LDASLWSNTYDRPRWKEIAANEYALPVTTTVSVTVVSPTAPISVPPLALAAVVDTPLPSHVTELIPAQVVVPEVQTSFSVAALPSSQKLLAQSLFESHELLPGTPE